MKRKPLSRRTFLRGAGGVAIALPFLEAMLPPMATANTTAPKRYVVSFCGTSCGTDRVSDPGAYGPLAASLPMSWKALEPVRQHVSLVSNTVIPTYPSSATTTPSNASSIVQQHGTTPAPMLAGVSSKKGMAVMVRAQTSDQFVADAIGQGTLYKSLQMRVQAIPYNGSRVDRDSKGIMSARGSLDNANALRPLVSPLEIYEKLFAMPSMPSMPGTPGTVDKTLSRRASILDLISEDSQRLNQRISGADRARMDLHFTKIRELEQRLELQAQMMSAGGMTGSGMMGSACGNLMHPGPDPAVSANVFGGWSDETTRGELMADMIALCLSCDMTRAVSWMLSFDQVWLKNQSNISGMIGADMHETAHKQTNGSSQADQLAAAQVTAENANWHAGLFARLVSNLAQMPEGSATVLDNTFLALLFAEGPTAHSRVHMRHLVAGNGAHIKLGQHINGGGEHPGRLLISGMTSVGVQSDTMNQLSGGFSAIEV